ncbi:MAG: tyrosine-type recombinase/integrase [Dinoroseobacter sp.]|nr:tyrosine-type recombinase/integrase [Dinoroseobacter sp.]
MDRALSSITAEAIETALYAKGGHGAWNEYKALKPVFEHLRKLRIIPKNPYTTVQIDKPETKGFPTATPEEIERFKKHWQVGTVERLVFDLALLTGAARVDLCVLGRKNIQGDILTFRRHKTGAEALVPMTPDLRAVIAGTKDIAPSLILNSQGRPFTKESLGNLYGNAAKAAGVESRLHGLRKAFCVYWAENGYTPHQIAAMSGHLTLSEIERYTKDVDRKRIIQAIAGNK